MKKRNTLKLLPKLYFVGVIEEKGTNLTLLASFARQGRKFKKKKLQRALASPSQRSNLLQELFIDIALEVNDRTKVSNCHWGFDFQVWKSLYNEFCSSKLTQKI
ncbi:hypothetical protein V6N13_025105 [Hibiscus sabdariffa]|uniref:Uncharacterized protein n=1 Tax=Hibiscus sabdariffa TaxID=183260 RepID=A0ABR2NMB2_9ROSI